MYLPILRQIGLIEGIGHEIAAFSKYTCVVCIDNAVVSPVLKFTDVAGLFCKIVAHLVFCHVGGPLYGPVAAGIARVGPFIDGFSVTIEVQTRLSAEVTR